MSGLYALDFRERNNVSHVAMSDLELREFLSQPLIADIVTLKKGWFSADHACRLLFRRYLPLLLNHY